MQANYVGEQAGRPRYPGDLGPALSACYLPFCNCFSNPLGGIRVLATCWTRATNFGSFGDFAPVIRPLVPDFRRSPSQNTMATDT